MRTATLMSALLVALHACASENSVESSPSTSPRDAVPDADSSVSESGGPEPIDGPLPEPKNHRAAADICSHDRPPGNFTPGGYNIISECTSDADCAVGGINGRCTPSCNGLGCFSSCTYDMCFSDDDCPTGLVCDCRDSPYFTVDTFYADANRCTTAGNCRTDADCGAGGWCSPAANAACQDNGDHLLGYFCHTPYDECFDDEDCIDVTPSAETVASCLCVPHEPRVGYCGFDQQRGHWACGNLYCYLV